MLKEQYVTAGELAETLGVAPTHLYWLARCGKIPPGEKLGRERVYSLVQADAIVDWYSHYQAARDGMAWSDEGNGVVP